MVSDSKRIIQKIAMLTESIGNRAHLDFFIDGTECGRFTASDVVQIPAYHANPIISTSVEGICRFGSRTESIPMTNTEPRDGVPRALSTLIWGAVCSLGAPIAQLVELRTFNPQVLGSSPSGGTSGIV